MELDEETIFELGCQSVWDSWEFAVAFQTFVVDRRQKCAERVADWRRFTEAGAIAKRKAARAFAENGEAVNARRRELARQRRQADPSGVDRVERRKWELRKAKAVARAVVDAL